MYANLAKHFPGDLMQSLKTPGLSERVDRYAMLDGAETNCRIAHNLGIRLMNSNCFAIFFSGIIAMSVQISICDVTHCTFSTITNVTP